MATVGTNKSDVLYQEGDFDDVFDGGKGNDILLGLEGDDILNGGSGRDFIDGGSGDDVITGSTGNDRMMGGDGEDTFVFAGKTNKDTILDFDVTTDLLQIKASKKIQDVDDVVKAAKQLKNGDLVIDLGKGNKITLKDVSKADFETSPEDHIEII